MQSAANATIFFEFPDLTITVLMRAFGDPEHVRKALSAACSHRRSIVTTHSSAYVAACIAHLSKTGLYNVEIFCGDSGDARTNWNYRVYLQGAKLTPYIRYHSQGKDETVCPLYQFLRVRIMRAYEHTAARKANRGGRPKRAWIEHGLWRKVEGLTPAVRARYERLEKAHKEREHAKHASIAKTPGDTAAVAGKGNTLGLKDKRRVRVDFSETWNSLSTLSKVDRADLDPDYDARQRELEQRYENSGLAKSRTKSGSYARSKK